MYASTHTLPAHTHTHSQRHPHTHVHSFWFLRFYTVLSYTGIMQCQSYFAIAFIVACCRHRQRQRQTTWQRWRQHSELETGIVDTAKGGARGSWSWRQALRQKPITTTTTSSKQLQYFVNTLDTLGNYSKWGILAASLPHSSLHRISTSLSSVSLYCCFITQVKCCGWRQEIAMKCNVTWKCKCREAATVFILPASHKWVWQGRAQTSVCVCICVCVRPSQGKFWGLMKLHNCRDWRSISASSASSRLDSTRVEL